MSAHRILPCELVDEVLGCWLPVFGCRTSVCSNSMIDFCWDWIASITFVVVSRPRSNSVSKLATHHQIYLMNMEYFDENLCAVNGYGSGESPHPVAPPKRWRLHDVTVLYHEVWISRLADLGGRHRGTSLACTTASSAWNFKDTFWASD